MIPPLLSSHPHPSLPRLSLTVLFMGCLNGCDPLVSLQGSFWPPWIIVMVIALPMTGIAHAAFKRLGIADHLQPVLLVYPALWALMTFLAWLVAFPW